MKEQLICAEIERVTKVPSNHCAPKSETEQIDRDDIISIEIFSLCVLPFAKYTVRVCSSFYCLSLNSFFQICKCFREFRKISAFLT